MKTTIRISKTTKQQLGKLGTTNETYEDIIKKLLEKKKKLEGME